MTWLGIYTVYGDLPVTYTAAQIEGVSAGVVQLAMQDAGYSGDSIVTSISVDPTSSVANPQVPGLQLCKCSLQVAFPDGVDPVSTEMLIASGLAYYSHGMGLPGNVVLTLESTSPNTSLGTPTTPMFPLMAAAIHESSSLSASLL
ncbi:hypothetical protein AB4Y43_01495 [Paraburkholderia sp. BR10872]|uniref:hypothetical protein n=1 Tax=Paraburkholderia sp. BR10872 TaxID=3236989 RepID=UPI0034D35C00